MSWKKVVQEKNRPICDICGNYLDCRDENMDVETTCDGYPLQSGNMVIVKPWAYHNFGYLRGNTKVLDLCDACIEKHFSEILEKVECKQDFDPYYCPYCDRKKEIKEKKAGY